MTCGWRKEDGSPHARGHGRWERRMTCGWRKGDGSPHARGQRRWGCGMTCGWRKGDGSPHARGQRRWGCGMTCGWRKGDGSPHPRGQGRGWEWVSAPHLHGTGSVRERRGDGTAGERAGRLSKVRKEGMGPRIREDKGGGGNGFPPPSAWDRLCAGTTGGGVERRVSARDACPRYGRGDGSPHARGQGRG